MERQGCVISARCVECDKLIQWTQHISSKERQERAATRCSNTTRKIFALAKYCKRSSRLLPRYFIQTDSQNSRIIICDTCWPSDIYRTSIGNGIGVGVHQLFEILERNSLRSRDDILRLDILHYTKSITKEPLLYLYIDIYRKQA